ncbi:MAG: hypothetical protein NTV97_19080 [Alphaproteobacteria bacterium]|nr:hypothetical protein [Alphaproteobacteria bacterium]
MTTLSTIPQRTRLSRSGLLAMAAGALLVAGIGGVAVAQPPAPPPVAPGAGAPPPPATGQLPQAVMLLTPVSIGKLQASDVVAVKGNVVEIYGNKFILQDDSGRMLVDLGPRGDDANAVTKGEQVSVQGRFDRGFIAAQVVSHADGRNQAFGPPAPAPPRPAADRGPGHRPPPR